MRERGDGSVFDCSTIIVSYNTFALTREAIGTALAAAKELRHEIIVVDNASPDGSGDRLRAAFADDERVRILMNESNEGFSRANNQGAAVARGAVLFFLNPDTLVHDDAIVTLVSFIRNHPQAGAVGPRVLNDDGTDQPSAMELPTPRWMMRHHLPLGSLLSGADRRMDVVPGETQPVDVVKGCALAISHDVFGLVGGWDESYFMYAEETELCRALLALGRINYYVRPARVTHFGGAASADRYAEEQIRIAESVKQYLQRHSPPSHLLLYRATGLAGFAVRIVLFSYLQRRHAHKHNDYQRRKEAAASLTRWFARELARPFGRR